MRAGSPLLGAGLFAAAGGTAVATLDAATFAASALVILLVRAPETEQRPDATAFRHQVVAGLRHLITTPILRRTAVATVLLFAGYGLVDAAVFALVDALREPPTFIIVLVSAQGAAALLSGSTATILAARVRPEVFGVVGAGLSAVGLGLLVVATLPTVFAGFIVTCAALPLVGVASVTLLQLHTSSDRMGRVSAAFDALSAGVYTGMIAVGAVLIGLIPVPGVLARATVGALAAAFVAARSARPARAIPVGAPALRPRAQQGS